MSLYSLEHPSMPVSIPDELEAFFHVLLYNGVRFLLHNYPSIVAFIKRYFDGYDESNGRMFSPELKRAIIYQQAALIHCNERLKFLCPDGTLHPINDVFSDLLDLFQKRYLFEDYQKQHAEWKRQKDAPRRPVVVPNAANPFDDYDEMPIESGDGFQEYLSSRSRAPPAPNPEPVLPPDVKAGMEYCRAHTSFRTILRRYNDKDGWNYTDKIEGDRLKHYVQDPVVLVKEDPMERPSKISRSDFRMPTIPEHKLDTF